LPPRDFPNYASGSWGPEQAHELLRRDGREWRDPARPPAALQGSAQTRAASQTTATAGQP
jgi:Glucose-6-phosphate dehydrogenase, C-terminal domain